MPTIYDYQLLDAQGRLINFEILKNKVILIVNVASLCGFTPQYDELQYLWQKYKTQDFVIIGFPCNQFANQEPQTDEEILTTCRTKFKVTFPIMRKIDVNGINESPLYTFLKNEKPGLLGFKGVRWNFEKFLITKTGKVEKRYPSQISPSEFENDIARLLKSS